MSNSRNVLLFVLALAAGFVYICNSVPQVQSEPVEKVEIGETAEELVAAGKKIFASDRAKCLTCHALGEDAKARCPTDMQILGERAATRKPGADAAEYLVESLYNPNAFIVSGYPKNQMTPVNKPPIAMSHDEILAVIAYLNSGGGTTDEEFINKLRAVQSPWRKGLLQPEERSEEAPLPILAGDAQRGSEMFHKKKNLQQLDSPLVCLNCHRVGKEGGNVAPELTSIGGSQSAEYVLESILDPNAVIVKGFREVVVVYDDVREVRGTPLEWIPSKEKPETLRLSVLEAGEPKERMIDLSEVTSVGVTLVGYYDADDEFIMLAGEHVSGDAESGVTVKVLEEGQWVERHIEADDIEAVRETTSPMPTDFAKQMTPQEVFDVIAFLMTQKSEK